MYMPRVIPWTSEAGSMERALMHGAFDYSGCDWRISMSASAR
jgi:hypothetical protein